MSVIVWSGAAIAFAGLGGLLWCILEATRLKRGGLSPDEGRRLLARIQAVNLAAVGVGFLGLAVVVAGLILG